MSMQDPISDLLTRIRNGQASGKVTISLPSSKQKIAIVELLKKEGYVSDYTVSGDVKKVLEISLKFLTLLKILLSKEFALLFAH